MKPLAVDLCCGLGGWSHGLLAEGWDVVGFDIERHRYGGDEYPAQLVLQDIRTLGGQQFKGKASLIVASPPCQKYSYMSMPWSRAKALIAWYRDPAYPERIAELNEIFDACVRIAREAECPIVLENVRGAQPWVGRARGRYGSFFLWGDVPAMMPMTVKRRMIYPVDCGEGNKNSGVKHGGDCFNDPSWSGKQRGVKQSGISGVRANGKGDRWFQDGAAAHGSRSTARKAASAVIAKIPLPLAQHIARVWKPVEVAA